MLFCTRVPSDLPCCCNSLSAVLPPLFPVHMHTTVKHFRMRSCTLSKAHSDTCSYTCTTDPYGEAPVWNTEPVLLTWKPLHRLRCDISLFRLLLFPCSLPPSHCLSSAEPIFWHFRRCSSHACHISLLLHSCFLLSFLLRAGITSESCVLYRVIALVFASPWSW